MIIVVVLCMLVVAAESAQEGESCTKNGVAGVCTNIKECQSALEDVGNKISPQLCGFDGIEPVVCCVSSAPKGTIHKRSPASYTSTGGDPDGRCQPIPSQVTAEPTGQKAWDKCLEYQKLVFPCRKTVALTGGYSRSNLCFHKVDQLISGGTNAKKNEFPHMAMIGYGEEDGLQFQCGGALISERFVLTAGHCISNKQNESISYIQLRTLRRSRLADEHRYRVRRIIPHPQYASPNKYHDIALLELERPVPLDEYTVPACLDTGAPANDSRASVTGWGRVSALGPTSDSLQKVILTKFDTLECAVAYSPHRLLGEGFDVNTQVCYGDRTNISDTCEGDSGGSLQIKSHKIACMYIVIGVTSFGNECGNPGVPGIYTRVLHYLDWIESHVWP